MTREDLEQISGLIDNRLDAKLDEKLEPLKKGLKRVEQQIKNSESSIVLHFDNRVGDHEKRIGKIEDHLGFPHFSN